MSDDEPELLFFDTFAHDVTQEAVNMDLVQFTQPVNITEIRIIPLGARVQSDSSSFIRLGATNPSKFHLDFYVNDLRKPGASTFDFLGAFEYNQNDCIHLPCVAENGRRIATDGLVLRGLYTTITLAVYGHVTKNIVDFVEDEPAPVEGVPEAIETAELADTQVWDEETPAPSKVFVENEEFQTAFYSDGDIPKDPRMRRTRSSSCDKEVTKTRRREWSRSPEVFVEHPETHFRPRPENRPVVVAPHRRPRSPSEVSRRPRSPSSNEEFPVAKSPGRIPVTVRSPTPSTPVEIPDEEIGSPTEELEDIDSDEEVMVDAEWDADYEPGFFEIINTFNPFEPLKKYEDAQPRPLEMVKRLLGKYEAKIEFRFEKFLLECGDNKSTWVHYAEQIVNQMTLYNGQDHARNDSTIAEFVKSNSPELNTLVEYIKIGLTFDYANAQPQPAYKIRHIKVGIRLIEITACYEVMAHYLLYGVQFNIFEKLFSMYFQEHMALSIRLMIFKAFYSILDSTSAIAFFLGDKNEFNGYKTLIELLQSNPTGRTMVAIRSLIRKLNLYETFTCTNSTTAKIFGQLFEPDAKVDPLDWDLLTEGFKEVLKLFTDPFSYAQPKRFLPASAQFEIPKDAFNLPAALNGAKAYMRANGFLESILLVVAARQKAPINCVTICYALIERIIKTQIGLNYLVDNMEQTNALVKELFGAEFDVECDTLTIYSSKNRALAMEIAYKVQTMYYLDGIIESKNNPTQLMDHLQSLYTLCFNPGRAFVVETICTEGNLLPILESIEIEKKRNAKNGSPDVKNKSPVLIYAVDLLDICVRNCSSLNFLAEYGSVLQTLVKSHDLFEPSVSAMLQEMSVYVKPLEMCQPSIEKFEDVGQLVELMNRSLEFITSYPGDLMMTLRIICHRVVRPYEGDHRELRYDYFLLEFFHANGHLTLMNILEKLNGYYQQPGIHSASLVTTQGVLLIQILLPTIRILRKLLTFIIQARNTEFKDLTAIEPLLKTYSLAHAVPERGLAFIDAQRVQEEIIKTLLAYTQPRAEDGFDTENIHKSLWTLMIGEVIKYTLGGPHCFTTGLLVLTELLPLPLPIPSREQLTEREIGQLKTERQMWSAHLHSQSNAIKELIQTTCPSSNPELLIILSRVCLQLSDLAPNMTLLVAKSFTDLIVQESTGVAGPQHARLLLFLTNLIGYPSVKVSIISILPGKLIELLDSILVTADESESHLQAQESIHTIFQNLLDSEVTMFSNFNEGEGTSLEMNLACALPSRDLLLAMSQATLGNLLTCTKAPYYINALRTLLILTEHDVSLICLKMAMNKKSTIKETLENILKSAKESYAEFKPILCLIMEFLRALINIEKRVELKNIPQRSAILTPKQLCKALDWPQENCKKKEHPLTQLLVFLETKKQEQVGQEKEEKDDVDKFDDNWEDHLQALIKYLNENTDLPEPVSENSTSQFDSNFDLSFPQAEGIVTQFSSRQVYFISDDNDDGLSVAHWLNVPMVDEEISVERVSCDLSELIQSCLPSDTNLTSDCKLLLHLSASPASNRDRQTAAHCYRTRRVDIDLTTGRPEKRIYVTPIRGRGYPRGNPTRGDLFRSRPPNTSRPPSLHVDDFTALETCGAQPTGPTGYNKLASSSMIIRGRGRGRYIRGFMKPHWARSKFTTPSWKTTSIHSPSPQFKKAPDGSHPSTHTPPHFSTRGGIYRGAPSLRRGRYHRYMRTYPR